MYEIGLANRLGNRETNQDRITVIEDNSGVLLVLADGMGGTQKGEMAAQTLIDVAEEFYHHLPKPITDAKTLFNLILTTAHNRIMETCKKEQIINPPGTTAVLCLVQGDEIQWGHVGDSRLYLFRDGLAIFRTTDHSYVEELYQKGEITRSEQDSHPRRNHITQCVGCLPQLPSITMGKGKTITHGDVVLLCSDGLWGALDDAHIGSLLTDAPIDQLVDTLAERAETSAYPHSDNISIIALRLKSEAPAQTGDEHSEVSLELSQPLTEHEEPQRGTGEKLQQAIDQIEEVIKKYEDEFDD